MTKKEVKEQVKKWMIDDIQSVIQGEKENVELLYCRPADVQEYITSIGGELDDFETNGWQWDYWVKVKIGESNYMLSGDGYYGNSADFSKQK